MDNKNSSEVDVWGALVKAFVSDPVTAICNAAGIAALIIAYFNDNFWIKLAMAIGVIFLLAILICRRTRLSKHKKTWEENSKKQYDELAAESKKQYDELVKQYDELAEKSKEQHAVFVAKLVKERREIATLIQDFTKKYKQCLDYSRTLQSYDRSSVDAFSQIICNSIEDIVSFILKETTCVCIKLLDVQDITDCDYGTWKIYTVGRSHSTEPSRSNNDMNSVFVKDNSDFEEIVSDQNTCFTVPDLPAMIESWKKNQKKKYKNSTDDYTYKSTIVFPIYTRMENADDIFQERVANWKEHPNKHIVGFLCVDSEKTFTTGESHNDFGIAGEVVGSIANVLYPVFSNIIKAQLVGGDSDGQ